MGFWIGKKTNKTKQWMNRVMVHIAQSTLEKDAQSWFCIIFYFIAPVHLCPGVICTFHSPVFFCRLTMMFPPVELCNRARVDISNTLTITIDVGV